MNRNAERKVERQKVISIYLKRLLCLVMIGSMLISMCTVAFALERLPDISIKSSYSSMSSKVNSTISTAQNRMTQLYDLDTQLLQSYFTQVQAKLSQLKTASGDTSALEAEIEELCNKIVMASAESKVVSARATWHRPNEFSYSDIEKTVKTFKDCGMNLVFVETFYHGYTIYKSDDIEIPYYPTLASSYNDTEKGIVYNDYLSAFLACCEEYGIEVHAWVEDFYVGVNSNTPIIVNHPDWIMYNDDGSVPQRKEGGAYIFIDPANLEVQDTLIDFYNDLFEKNPKLRGLNLDYIRYPVSDQTYDTGYTIAAMKGFYDSLDLTFTGEQLSDRSKMAIQFKKLFNEDYLLGGQQEANQNYQLWVEYRTGVITDFVERVKNEVKKPNDIILSTAVFASISESVNSKKADWQQWYQNGWIDIATPMAYYSSASSVKTNVKNMISLGGNNCLYYTGLASSYSGYPAYYNKEFVEASYDAGASGYVIFASQQIIGHADVQLALSSGVGRKQGVLPHADLGQILKASFDDILDKADRLYISAGGMTQAQKSGLKSAFDQILAKSYDTSDAIQAIYNSVSSIKTNLRNYASGYSYDRINQQLSELLSILSARCSMKAIAEKETPYHKCEHVCPTCDKCTDADCAESACRDKCDGHTQIHVCEHVCEQCGKCVDAVCTESVCTDKCGGHTSIHTCEHVCEQCGKCTDADCAESVCTDKCGGHTSIHACEHVCEQCGKCTDVDCAESVCQDKCNGHVQSEQPTPPQAPESQKQPTAEKLNFFQRIWQAIVNFFSKLFGKK